MSRATPAWHSRALSYCATSRTKRKRCAHFFFHLFLALLWQGHDPESFFSVRLHAYPSVPICQGHEKSTEALESAIVRFPVVATLLSNSLAFDLPPAMVSHARAQPAGAFTDDASYVVSLLSELYVARSAPLWKDPASLAWLRRAIVAATLKLDDSTLEDVRVGQRVWSEGVWDRGVAPAGIIRAAFISGAFLERVPLLSSFSSS